jgi:F-type H+-transporting ATPase subunit beta
MNTQSSSDHAVWSVPVGEQVLGRVLNGFGEPIDGGEPIVHAPRAPVHRSLPSQASIDTPQMLNTGIKVVDLFAPIVRGGTAGLFAGAGMGKIVLMQELTHNVAQRGGHAVCLGLEERAHAPNGLMLEMRSGGVHDKLAMVFTQRNDAAEARERAMLAALTIAEHFRDHKQDVLFFVDWQCAPLLARDHMRERLRSGSHGSMTTLLFGVQEDNVPAPAPMPLDTRLVFSSDLAKRGLYPAVDPLQSSSRLLDLAYVGEHHVEVVQKSRELLRRYIDLHDVVETHGLEALSHEDYTIAVRALRLQHFLTQPFAVAEPWTDVPGEQVALDDTIASVSAIIAGRHDNVPDQAFRFVGTIEQVVAQAAEHFLVNNSASTLR